MSTPYRCCRALILVICYVTAVLSPLNAQEPDGLAIPSRSVLRGRVENSERLPPVAQTYRAGSKINLAKLQALTPDNHWYRIPEWAAGTWKTETNTQYYIFNYGIKTNTCDVNTFMARGEDTRGFQRDRCSNIWHYCARNFVTQTEKQESWGFSLVKEALPLEVSQNKMIVQFRSIRFNVDKSSGTILRTYQCESIQTYTPYHDGLVKVLSSIKAFDENGTPLHLTKAVSFHSRILPFISIDLYKGRNMRGLLAEYLTSQGLSELVPNLQQPAKAGIAIGVKHGK